MLQRVNTTRVQLSILWQTDEKRTKGNLPRFLKESFTEPMGHQDINSPGNIGALKSKQVIRNCKFWTDTCFVPNSLEYCIRTETSCRQSKKACVKLSTTGCKWSISYIRLNWPFTLHVEKKPSGNDGNNKYKIKAYIQSNMRQSYKR